MSNINFTFQMGRLGKDPEIRNLSEDSKVASFSIANTEKYKNRAGELVENTNWHKINCWGKKADIVEKYVKKGDLIGVFGKVKYRSYDDKDGIKRNITEIEANEIVLMPKNSTESGKPESKSDDDIPEFLR